MFITNSSQGPGGQKLVFNCQVPRWFWLDGLEKALNKNTINFGFLPISFFSFAGDKERKLVCYSQQHVCGQVGEWS